MSSLAHEHAAPADVRRSGLTNAALAFGWWGFVFPLVIVAVRLRLEQIGYLETGGATRLDWSLEFLCHRTMWALATCLVLLAWLGRWSEATVLLRSPRSVALLSVTALLILLNWTGFVYGAATGRLSHASLGYYINPLFSVALGVLVLGERMRRAQVIAIALAAVGVVWETYRLGQLPWISLLVAGAFGLYGLFRKQISATAIAGLTVETLLLLPLAAGYLWWRETSGPAPAFGRDTWVTVLLILSGVGTAAPLIWFANAAKRLPLSTVAFLQFIVPTGQLLMAVTLNGETLKPAALVSFAFIWIGVAAFLLDIRRAATARTRHERAATVTEY
jgi:chloramphenicol-sensitive protein RarD